MADDATAIRRAVRLLEEAALRGGRIRFAEAAALLAPVGPNTVARLLRELVRAGVLERSRDRAYALTDKPMFWAASVPRGRDLRALARPHLVRLNRELEATAALVVPYGGRMTILDRILDPRSPALLSPGEFVPIDPTYLGGVFLVDDAALADDARLARWLARVGGCRVDPEGLSRIARRARADGVHVDAGVLWPRVHRVSAPVPDRGRVAACLGIGAMAGRGPAFAARARALVAEAAATLARALARAGG